MNRPIVGLPQDLSCETQAWSAVPQPRSHRRLEVRSSPALICLLCLGCAAPVFGQALLTTAGGTTRDYTAVAAHAGDRAGKGLLPTTEGTTWNYEMVDERPSTSLDLTEPNEKERFAVTYRVGGVEKIDPPPPGYDAASNDFLKLEVYRGDTLENTDLIAVDEHGIVSPARTDAKGVLIKFEQPQRLVAAPLRNHASWNFDGKIGDTKVNQRCEIGGEEDVTVPAGKFHAWRIHCEQTSPASATMDRWFVPGTGFVKFVTMVKTPSGSVLQQTSLVLKGISSPALRAEAADGAESGKLSVTLSDDPASDSTTSPTTFPATTKAIYARWQGHGLRPFAKVRAVWIADNTENAPANYKIDETSTVVKTVDSDGTFTLDRPDDGWSPGDYRVEFHVDNAPAQTVKFKMAK
jgi:hypothetical protein